MPKRAFNPEDFEPPLARRPTYTMFSRVSNAISRLTATLFRCINPFARPARAPVQVAVLTVGNKRRVVEYGATSGTGTNHRHVLPASPASPLTPPKSQRAWAPQIRSPRLFVNSVGSYKQPQRSPHTPVPKNTLPYDNPQVNNQNNNVIDSPIDTEMQDASPLQVRQLYIPPVSRPIKQLLKKQKRAHFNENPISRQQSLWKGESKCGGIAQFRQWRSPERHELDSPHFDSPIYRFANLQEKSPLPIVPPTTPDRKGRSNTQSLENIPAPQFISSYRHHLDPLPKSAAPRVVSKVTASPTIKTLPPKEYLNGVDGLVRLWKDIQNTPPRSTIALNEEIDELINAWNDQNDAIFNPEISERAKARIERNRRVRNKERKVYLAAREALAEEAKIANEQRIAAQKAKEEAEYQRRQEEFQRQREAAEQAKVAEQKRVEDEQRAAELKRYESEFWRFPVSEDWRNNISKAMATAHKTVLVQKNSITRYDFGTLLPQKGGQDSSSAWLNDQIVNTFLDFMVGRALEKLGHDKQGTEPAPYWAFNSNWVSAMASPAKFHRWASKKGVNLVEKKLLDAKTIFFPICQNHHWTMLIVYPQRRHIEYLDSLDLSGSRGGGFIQLVRGWLKYELGDEYEAEDWIEIKRCSMPQENGSDCGVFTIWNSVMRLYGTHPALNVADRVMPEFRLYTAAILLNGGFTGDFEFPEIKDLYFEKKDYMEVMDRRGNASPFTKRDGFWANQTQLYDI